MDKKEFEKLLIAAAEELPESIREKIENVVFVLEEGEAPGGNLFGLYHGVPKTGRGQGYSFVLPDKIVFYKKTMERHAISEDDLRRLIRLVVWHEIGHHLGFSEREVRRLERKWEKENRL